MNIARSRLYQQQIAAPRFQRPSEIVGWLGAVQAQDFSGALWAIGLRLVGATEADVTKAIAERSIVRTWPMRGTLHFVAAADIHWMRALLTPRIIAGSARRHQELELSTAVFRRCEKLFLKALRGGRQLTREAMLALLEKARISADGHRSYHILCRLAQEGLLCFGTHEGKQPTFTLLDEWCPASKPRDLEDALAELARRYFTSHGPATLTDFGAWSGLTAADARLGLKLAGAPLAEAVIGGKSYWFSTDMPKASKASSTIHLLPAFDEYMLGYRDRTPALAVAHSQKICPGSNGMFLPTVVVNGQVAGTWKRTFKKDTVSIATRPFAAFNPTARRALPAAAGRYGSFLARKVSTIE